MFCRPGCDILAFVSVWGMLEGVLRLTSVNREQGVSKLDDDSVADISLISVNPYLSGLAS